MKKRLITPTKVMIRPFKRTNQMRRLFAFHYLLFMSDLKEKDTKMKKLIGFTDLVEFGYKPSQARDIIKRAKKKMVNAGYGLYNNKRLGVVPVNVVEQITGLSLSEKGDD